tara:strand:- start:406 stop:996 length:591 start_codon:yes stop_codon:yes gene_type:complete
MIYFKNSAARLFYAIFFVLILVACGNDDDEELPTFPPTNRGDIQANRLKITFILSQDTTQKATYEFYDPDGIGGNAPIVIDTIKLLKPLGATRQYKSSIVIYNDSTSLNEAIKEKDNRYIICYRGMNTSNLRFGDPNLDRDGQPLGIEATWSTIDVQGSSDSGNIRITMNFQPATKDGTCDPGSRILEAIMPYVVI